MSSTDQDRDRDRSPEARRRQQNFESVTFSYLKLHYFDAEALRLRTMVELSRAIRTGRLVAFTGSMTTQDRGYKKWGEFVDECFKQAERHFEWHAMQSTSPQGTAVADRLEHLRSVVGMFEAHGNDEDAFDLDKRVSFSVIGETVDVASQYSGRYRVNPNHDISDELFLNRQPWLKDSTILDALLHGLGIDRLITLNYDLEAELEYCHRGPPPEPGQNAIEALGECITDADTGSIVKRLSGAQSMVSDMFNRERADRLIEFAVGSADHEFHVLHLHGRADAFDSMVVSYRDYDRLYRRSGLSKAPFEHALKLLFAGNPILFVGIGMTETEVNRTLQDYVGDYPYRRIMPTFLLWNSYRDTRGKVNQRSCDVFRIDMLHRLGVLTIFSHELPTQEDAEWESDEVDPSLDPHEAALDRLHNAIVNLAVRLGKIREKRLKTIAASRWRSMRGRVQSGRMICAWEVASPVRDGHRLGDLAELPGKLTIAIGRAGIGKGSEARRVADAWRDTCPGGKVLLLNADYCFDTDTLLNLVGDFLRAEAKAAAHPFPESMSRNTLLRQEAAFRVSPRTLIIFLGVERLFGTNGEPLSAEFDDMLRNYVHILNNATRRSEMVGMMIFATPRTRAYFDNLGATINWKDLDKSLDGGTVSRYMAEIERGMKSRFRALPGIVIEEKKDFVQPLSAYRRALYAAYLQPRHLEREGVGDRRGRLAIDVLTVMAHIGQPVEEDVLFLAPRIQRRFRLMANAAAPGDFDARRVFCEVLVWLRDKKLVIPLKPFRESSAPMQRYGLHATLLSELRERSGVPLSEAVLSTAFNMSLYTAQPTDGPLPEASLHDELGHLIDWLIGANKDQPFNPALEKPFGRRRDRPDAVAALRAALAVIRGFYSTTALLTLEGKDRHIGPERDGALTEHAERLERLLSAFRGCIDALVEARGKKQAGPFYPDEIVWLYNEIGVVKLAQGDLYEARFAFNEADRFNREYVEFADRSHNWRRITLNQIVLDIERAKLEEADRRILQIETEIGPAKIEKIRAITSQGPIPLPTDPHFSHEETLAVGLIAGYRGICSHILGESVDALEHYDTALTILRRLDERRAYAAVLRHRAALLRETGSRPEATMALDLAIAAAESVHQMDLVHHSRIQRANGMLDRREIDAWTRAGRQLHDALVYADTTDMYRVRVEARANLAMARLISGDFEVALEHASDALTVATRFGLSLRKISLRILVGRILIQRGDPLSGRALIESGKVAAGRVGYQQAVSRAQSALMSGSLT